MADSEKIMNRRKGSLSRSPAQIHVVTCSGYKVQTQPRTLNPGFKPLHLKSRLEISGELYPDQEGTNPDHYPLNSISRTPASRMTRPCQFSGGGPLVNNNTIEIEFGFLAISRYADRTLRVDGDCFIDNTKHMIYSGSAISIPVYGGQCTIAECIGISGNGSKGGSYH